MPRKRFSEREVIETLAWHGVVVRCYRCKEYLCHVVIGQGLVWPKGNAIEREHVTEIALGGADAPYNCAYSHKACHHVATNGTKATTAGSSKQRIAKVRRLRGENKPKPKRTWGSRKIQSAPFPKRKRSMQKKHKGE